MMSERYSSKINRYCAQHGITVPAGFARRPASRYAVVMLGVPAKLVARTWLHRDDVIYYIEHMTEQIPIRILDFKDMMELSLDGSNVLARVKELSLSPE